MMIYREPVTELVRAMKFNGNLTNARILGSLLAEWLVLHAEMPEAIIPVPVHNRRLRQRGFNQALELARPIGKRLGLDVDTRLCVKSVLTADQVGLAAHERRRNIRGAFSVNGSSPYRHVALVDDVLTTGSTVSEICRVMHRAGIQRIDVWVVARAAPDESGPSEFHVQT